MTPFVTCKIFGQMGNQLYQVATTLAYAFDYGATPLFPELHLQQDRIDYNRQRLFFRLDTSWPKRRVKHVFQERIYYSAERAPFRDDQLLAGYFQSWRHFDHHKEKILSLLAPSEAVLSKLRAKYQALLDHPCTVALHVRTQCKTGHTSTLHPFIGFDYYRDAMARYPEEALFAVFSDRINWCKHHFPQQFARKMVFIEGNDGVEDCFLFSMLRHQIICNSTFSWWGAYFNQKPDRIVITPQYWRDPKCLPNFPTQDYFPPDWVLMPTSFDVAWPEDMEAYGDTFQSVNG